MNCIIVDDEPLAREGIKLLINEVGGLHLQGTFRNAGTAAGFLADNDTDLIFLDIQMPGMNGIDFARSLPKKALIIFTTAFAEYALDSYEVDAIDYLVKPIESDRFRKAVEKACLYQGLLRNNEDGFGIEQVTGDYVFIRSDRKIFKVGLSDILFIQGLNNYVVIHTADQKIITAMNVKTIYEQLPASLFVRISKSFIVNIIHIGSFDNNSVYIGKNEISIGNAFRDNFFETYVNRKLLGR